MLFIEGAPPYRTFTTMNNVCRTVIEITRKDDILQDKVSKSFKTTIHMKPNQRKRFQFKRLSEEERRKSEEEEKYKRSVYELSLKYPHWEFRHI